MEMYEEDPGDAWDCESHENGAVCMFSLTRQHPLHVVRCPSWFQPVYDLQRYKWSPDSKN